MRGRRWAGLALAAVTLAGCGQTAPPVPTTPPAWLRLQLRFVPAEPVARHYDPVRLQLSTPAGAPLQGAQVELRPEMTGMVMPDLGTVSLSPAGGGLYTGRILPLMGGRWAAIVSVHVGGQAAEVRVPFTVAS